MRAVTRLGALVLSATLLGGCGSFDLATVTGADRSASPTSTRPATTPDARMAQSDVDAKVGADPHTVTRGDAMIVASSATSIPAGIVAAGEQAAAAVRELDRHASANPLLVVVPRDENEYTEYTGVKPGNQLASTVTRTGTLPYVVVAPWTVRHANDVTARETLAHEAFHALTLETMPQSRPLWLLEGWAEYVGQKLVPQAPHKRTDIRPHLPSDEELRGANAADAYYVAFTFARFLRDTYGNDAVMAFYTDAVTTTTGMETLAQRHFHKGLTQLETDYDAWYPSFR